VRELPGELKLSLNKRTGGCLIRHRFVDSEPLGTIEFGKKDGLDKRTGICLKTS
jgi:hypothetical protein